MAALLKTRFPKMDIETLKSHALSKPGTSFDFPFGPETMVIRVIGKLFALIPADSIPPRINLKCDPTLAEIFRQNYAAVTPGYHMNKRHWNTVLLDGSIPDTDLLDMVDHSYEQVVKTLPKVIRDKLQLK
jgi:predicted DNA-binding protein (MmcQ/YjbR family)